MKKLNPLEVLFMKTYVSVAKGPVFDTFFTEEKTGITRLSNGFILKTKKKSAFAVIPTADSSLYPQILEIKTN